MKNEVKCPGCGKKQPLTYCVYEGRELCEQCAVIWENLKDEND